MKRPIALMLISIMVLMLSAFSFADVDYSLEIKAPKDEIVVTNWDKPFFITVWVTANVGDELEKLVVTVEDEDTTYSKTFEEDIDYEFGEKVFKYRFWAPELTSMKEFEITVLAEFKDETIDEPYDSKSVVVVAEEEEEEEEEMDDDMYPAAPAVANKLLKAAGIPNRVGNVNLIAAVAKDFDGVEKGHEDFTDEVEEFLVDKLNKIFEVEYSNLGDFEDEIADLEKPNMKSEENKMKVKVSDVEDEDDEDDDDDDDEDDDDDDEEKAAKPEKNKK